MLASPLTEKTTPTKLLGTLYKKGRADFHEKGWQALCGLNTIRQHVTFTKWKKDPVKRKPEKNSGLNGTFIP